MNKVNYTRTINPLQFDALEPRRFEDLVRQLLYDFRPWRQLEPTGRMGNDGSFDARGWEVQDNAITEAHDDKTEEQASKDAGDRIWLVQCKRERAIGPTKLVGYLEAIEKEDVRRLHGVIVAACADFSKRSRDEFRSWCIQNGIAEFYLWGKAELEDALFQPNNDGLLFAYFGLSLTIRRRSEQARLRSQTTIKRKLKRAIVDKHEVLIRDVTDEDYPYMENDKQEIRWWVFNRPKLTFRGLECLAGRYFAYIDNDNKSWDFANSYNDGRASNHADPWHGHQGRPKERQEIFAFWHDLPEKNKAWLEVWGVIPFDSILEIDEIGDDITDHSHIYVAAFEGMAKPFKYDYAELSGTNRLIGSVVDPIPSHRIEKFPTKFRKPLPKHLLEGVEKDHALDN